MILNESRMKMAVFMEDRKIQLTEWEGPDGCISTKRVACLLYTSMFPLLRKYPVQIFNWHAWESLPEIGEAALLTGKCLMAGLELSLIHI